MFLRTDSTTLKCTVNTWTKIILLFCTICTCYSKTFRIAWLAPGQNSGQKINSYTSVAGLKLALASVMSNTMILNGHTIEVEYFPTDCSSQASMHAAMKAKHFNPDVIIGPPCQEGLKIVAQLGANWNLPVFTWYNQGIEFGSTLTYPTLVRMIPSLDAMGLSLLHLFRQNKWKQFAFIYDDGEPWSLYEEAVRAAIANTNINMLSSHGVNSTVTDAKLWQLFSHIKKYSWIFVFACPASEIRRYMLIADQAGMGNGSYIFIQLDHQLYTEKVLNSEVLTNQRWWRGGPQDGAARRVYRSLIHVLLDPMNDDKVPTYAIPRNRYEEFSSMAMAEANTQNPGWKLPLGGQPDVYSLYLYDAILVWSALVDRMDKAGKNYRNGKLLVKEAKQFFADGATGYFSLNQNVDRNAKMFILYMENDGSFKPSQILRFNSTNGYEIINLKALHEQERRHGAQTKAEINQINTIGSPTTMPSIFKTTLNSERLLPAVETPTAIKTTQMKPSIPPPPPEHSLSGNEIFQSVRTIDPLVSRLLAKVESLEKIIKDHELHAHAHIPDHTHTPHPLLLRLSSTPAPMVKVSKKHIPAVDGHAHVSAYPIHHTSTPHALALDNLLGHRNLGHAHFPHQHVHVPTQPTNHIHSANDTYRQQTPNAHIPLFYDHSHHPHHWHPHPHYPGYNRGFPNHAPGSHMHQHYVPSSHRPMLPTYKTTTTTTTTLAPQTTNSRKNPPTSKEQLNGHIDEAMLNRISSKIVDQLTGTSTNITHSNNEERVVNDWLSGGIDDIGPGLLLAAKTLEQKRLLNIINQRLYEQSLQNNRQKTESSQSKTQANPPPRGWSTPSFNNAFAPVTDPLASLWGAAIIW